MARFATPDQRARVRCLHSIVVAETLGYRAHTFWSFNPVSHPWDYLAESPLFGNEQDAIDWAFNRAPIWQT